MAMTCSAARGIRTHIWKMEINDPNQDGSQPNLGRLNCSFLGTRARAISLVVLISMTTKVTPWSAACSMEP